MAQLRFRLATREDTPEIVALLNATFRGPIDAATWEWYVYGNPIAPSRVYLILEPDTDAPAGVIGFAPIQLRISGATVAGDYAHHLALKPMYRDTLSYVALLRRSLQAQASGKTKLTIGPPNRTAYPIHKKLMKWVDFGYLDCLKKLSPAGKAHTCQEVKVFPDTFEPFYARVSKNLNFCVEKTVEWMNWRFCRRPGSIYTAYTVGTPKEMAGYIVLKRWQDPDGYQKAHIIDFHAIDEASLTRLTDAAECYATGCNELNLWSVEGDPYRRRLETMGFAAGFRQPFLARQYDGSPIRYPGGACSLSYGDGDSQY
jgi:hypothetical protein